MKRYIDIAVNLTDPMFKGSYHGKQVHISDLSQVIERAMTGGVEKMVVTGTHLEDSRAAVELAAEYRSWVRYD